MSLPVKEIRVLTRGVKVVETLCRLGACSLADLHRATGLPKSTLRRILVTFEQANFIRCSLADGLFRSNIHVPAYAETATSPFIGRIVAAATPVLEELARKVVWPSDMLVRDGLHLQIVETNRSLTPLLVNRSEIGDRVDMLSSAVGRAYLAFCTQAERDEILKGIRKLRGDRSVSDVPRILRETRDRGYGERDSGFTGGTNRYPFLADKLYAIAVPVHLRGRVLCCINLLWPRTAITNANDTAAMATLLKDCANKVVGNYRRML